MANLSSVSQFDYKSLVSEFPKVKVIITSGYSLNGYFREIFEAGACGYLHKPFTTKDILKIVRKNLDK